MRLRGSRQRDDLSRDSEKRVIEEYLATVKLLESQRSERAARKTGVEGIIPTLAFSLGAIGFVILSIQICVQFMRYYARLAELYSAQATALLASHGDTELAARFMEQFSPLSVSLGKTPATVYEKAFEAVANALRVGSSPVERSRLKARMRGALR
jgi:hypothetical protein